MTRSINFLPRTIHFIQICWRVLLLRRAEEGRCQLSQRSEKASFDVMRGGSQRKTSPFLVITQCIAFKLSEYHANTSEKITAKCCAIWFVSSEVLEHSRQILRNEDKPHRTFKKTSVFAILKINKYIVSTDRVSRWYTSCTFFPSI